LRCAFSTIKSQVVAEMRDQAKKSPGENRQGRKSETQQTPQTTNSVAVTAE
jgi:hypothetical protein